MKSFVKVLLVLAIPLILVALLAMHLTGNLMQESARKEMLKSMHDKWEILAEGVYAHPNKMEHARAVRAVSRKTDLRISIISSSGRVLDDSYLNHDQVLQLDNHQERPEIKAALFAGEGYSIRFSKTAEMDMIYFARRLNDDRILRIAYPATYLAIIQRDFLSQNLYIFLFWFCFVTLTAAFFARQVSTPLKKLDQIVVQIESGQSEIQFPQFSDPTMINVSGLIYRIHHAMINEQKRLHQEKEKLHYIMGILEEGIILLDGEQRILHSNDKAATYLGVPLQKNAHILHDINDFKVIHFLKEIVTINHSEIWKAKPFGNRTFQVNLTVLDHERLMVFYDVTEERKYDRFKSELIENISHELRTPLSMIQGYAETLLNEPDMPEKTSTRFLQKIHNSTERINEIINNLLELHKLESIGRKIKLKEPTQLIEIIQEINEWYGNIQGKTVTISNTVSAAFIHHEHLFSILSNLIDNAIKYARGNTVAVTISETNNRLELRVDDEGPAIPTEEKERIFQRFYTVSRSRNKSSSGTGLGLPIVKHIAHLYDGSVTVTENPQGGNRFTVTLLLQKPISPSTFIQQSSPRQ